MRVGCSLLFVCADPERRAAFEPGLRSAGWLPLFVPSAERARAALRQFTPPVVVYDSATLADRRDGAAMWDVNVPVVLLTGIVTVAAAAIASCAAVVAPSCTAADLAAIIDRVAGGETGIVWPTPAEAAIA
jgi:hypothetical protein